MFELCINVFVLKRENKRQKAKILTNETGPETGYRLEFCSSKKLCNNIEHKDPF